jgi:O-acetyl-ADP-ribose deacetylase (regulator of RNase III)
VGDDVIRYVEGDILEAQTEAIVNTVNCVGVMGRGIALQFKNAFPGNFKAYAAACKRGEVQPGRMFVYETGELTGPRYIINFPTKVHWRGKSRIEHIESGLEALVAEVKALDIRSIAIPPLGSGLGGLAWTEVRPLIDRALAEVPEIDAEVYEPVGVPAAARGRAARARPKMTPGRAALVGLMDRYLLALMDPSITLLEVHKLMYFLQAAGEPLRLRYAKAWYGPYAENLRHVLAEVEGHLIAGYASEGDAPDAELALLPGAASDADSFLSSNAQTQRRFDRVARLVEGYETPFGLELLATIHWVATHEGAGDRPQIEDATRRWGHRKRQFTQSQIGLGVDRLESQDWLDLTPVQ